MEHVSDPPLVRVVVYLELTALEDLELLVHYRRGGSTRSAIVREAISWLRAREAAWLIRTKRQQQLQTRRAAEDARALAMARADRDRIAVEQLVDQALAIVRDDD
jgi:hypothetical protein